MDLHKLKVDEIRNWDAGKVRDTENDIRRELVNIRMNIYQTKSQHGAKIQGLKKSLARLLTIKGEKANSAKTASKAKGR